MRVAIPLEEHQVAQHMGHCPAYLVADVKENRVAATAEVPNPRHGPGGPPPIFLAHLGVTHVVGWGAPEHLLRILSQLNIQYTLGARGEAHQVLQDFLSGTLELSQEGTAVDCDHHEH